MAEISDREQFESGYNYRRESLDQTLEIGGVPGKITPSRASV
jgi:hypothetical protein